jgi:hypothetical protein
MFCARIALAGSGIAGRFSGDRGGIHAVLPSVAFKSAVFESQYVISPLIYRSKPMTTDYEDPGERKDEQALHSDQDSADELAEQLVSRFYSGSQVPPAEAPAPRTGPIKLPQPLLRRDDSVPKGVSHFLELMFPHQTARDALKITPQLRTRIEQIWLLAMTILKSENAALKWFHTPSIFTLSGSTPSEWLTSLQECDVVEGMLMKLYPSEGHEDDASIVSV